MITDDSGSMQANMSRGGGGRGLPDVDGFDWPDAMPAFTSNAVLVDPKGYAWVVRETAAGEAPLVDVFGRDGTLKARVRLPTGCEIAGFGTDAVYLARTPDASACGCFAPPTASERARSRAGPTDRPLCNFQYLSRPSSPDAVGERPRWEAPGNTSESGTTLQEGG